MTVLLPCPFCGGKAVLYERPLPLVSPFYYFFAVCEDCGGEKPGGITEKEAIASWNTRYKQGCEAKGVSE